MSGNYLYLHLRSPDSDRAPLERAVDEAARGGWRDAGRTVWGAWEGLFGVASNELLVITAEPEDVPAGGVTLPDAVEVLDSLPLAATLRPNAGTRLVRPGLYVFRSFDVRGPDVDEFIELSVRAWEQFENAAAYSAEPQGLFRPSTAEAEAPERLLLVTWYDGLGSWEASRHPAPGARKNFAARRALTLATRAVATRLLSS
jgi:hypothetical protein